MLHFEREYFLVEDGVGLAATLDHQVPGAVAVKFGDGFEEVKEVPAVGGVQSCDKARVNEDELRPVALFVDLGKL